MTNLLALIVSCVAAIVATATLTFFSVYYIRYMRDRKLLIRWLDRLKVDVDMQRISLANLQDSVDFLIHKRVACRESFERYPAPSSELIQEQFEERLRQAGWDFSANAEYPARIVWFVDSKELINSSHGCRFYDYLQASDHDLHDRSNLNRFDGCHICGVHAGSVDESIRRWKSHGFDNKKRFELLDRHLNELIGSVENSPEIPGPEFPRYPWPSGIGRFETQENHPCGTF